MTLLVSHLPKTSGTSLRRLVAAHNPDTVFVYGGELALANPDPAFVARLREASPPPVIMGHFSFGAHRLLGVAPRYTIMLREPVSRVVSLYRHQQRLPDSPFAGMTLRDFVASGVTEMTNNHACRMIAGVAPESGTPIMDRWLLGHALHNLRRHYRPVGITGRNGDYLAELGRELGWPAAEMPRDNVAPGQAPPLDAPTLALICEHNALDIELYDTVVAERRPSAPHTIMR